MTCKEKLQKKQNKNQKQNHKWHEHVAGFYIWTCKESIILRLKKDKYRNNC